MPGGAVKPAPDAATYPRGRGEPPFRVVYDRVAQHGRGLFRVYIGPKLVGSLVSFPGADDCQSLLRRSRESEPLKWTPTPLQQQMSQRYRKGQARLRKLRGAA